MTVVNTNISALIGLNQIRLTNNGLQTSLERLSSGLRINRGADDPSGLSISKGMEAQIGGIRVSIQNAEDGKSLIRTADGSLAETGDILLRMRDLLVRASNAATWTTTQISVMVTELDSLANELTRKAGAVTFNTKVLFTGAFGNGLTLQIGPNNGSNNQIQVTMSNVLGSALFNMGSTSLIVSVFNSALSVTGAGGVTSAAGMAFSLLSNLDAAINKISNTRSSIGIQERRIDAIIDDLKAQETNLSAAKSRIMDADMAVEIAEFTRLQILQQTGMAILAQANAQPQSVLQLIR